MPTSDPSNPSSSSSDPLQASFGFVKSKLAARLSNRSAASLTSSPSSSSSSSSPSDSSSSSVLSPEKEGMFARINQSLNPSRLIEGQTKELSDALTQSFDRALSKNGDFFLFGLVVGSALTAGIVLGVGIHLYGYMERGRVAREAKKKEREDGSGGRVVAVTSSSVTIVRKCGGGPEQVGLFVSKLALDVAVRAGTGTKDASLFAAVMKVHFTVTTSGRGRRVAELRAFVEASGLQECEDRIIVTTESAEALGDGVDVVAEVVYMY